MPEDSPNSVETATAWSEFCDLLKQAGDVILRDDLDTSLFDRAEGHRYLTRLLRAGCFSFAENTGPLYPEFRPMPDLVKMGLDNPDNFYVSASVNGRYKYRIRGKRGTIHYLSFAAQNQNFAAKDKITGGAGHLEDSELILEPDGSFEIIASQEEQPGNWLQLNPDTKQILIRQTFLDKNKEQPVEVDITCLDADGPPPPLDPANVRNQLLGSAMYAIGCSQWFADWVVDFLNHATINAFHLPPREQHRRVGGDPNVVMPLGRWKLADNEVLVISFTPPECHYWNFQLGNIWAESLDYRNHAVHINSGGAKLNNDGSCEIVVAHEDPGADNWIDTASHEHGTMAFRWVRAKEHPVPNTKVITATEYGR